MPQNFALIPWRHHTEIITKCKTVDEALFYINKTIENNWSRAILVHQMEVDLYQRQGKSVNNPTIGLLICKSKKKTVVEWSLSNMVSPIGVAEYKLLPKAEDLQKQIDEL